jgi:acyl-CoA thioester hydrolase
MHIYKTQTSIRVRYAETDQMGYAYYGSYAAWFEVARVEALRLLGVSYRDLEEAGVMLPVAAYAVNYLLPVRYDDEVRIETIINELPTARIKFAYTCYVGGVEVTRAETTLFFMDAKTRRPIRCPQALSTALAQQLGLTSDE